MAEALKTTKEAIHFEVERLREAKANTSSNVAVKPIVKVAMTAPETKQRYLSDLTYLVGVLPLFEQSVADKIRGELTLITGETIEALEEQVLPPAKAEVLFRMESFLDKNPRKVFEEEFVHNLTKFRDLVGRSKLKIAKEEQAKLDGEGDGEASQALLATISEQLKLRQLPPYTKDILSS